MRGEPFDPARHMLAHEVKAITYHELKVERDRRRVAGGSDRGHLRDVMTKGNYTGPLEHIGCC